VDFKLLVVDIIDCVKRDQMLESERTRPRGCPKMTLHIPWYIKEYVESFGLSHEDAQDSNDRWRLKIRWETG